MIFSLEIRIVDEHLEGSPLYAPHLGHIIIQIFFPGFNNAEENRDGNIWGIAIILGEDIAARKAEIFLQEIN